MRQQTCTTVTLRQRPIRNGRISLYLDYYPAVRNPKTMKLSRREYLGFYIYATPKNAIELDYNNEIRKHSKKCTFYTLRFGCSFAAVNTIKPQLL